jgi:hypothetical protein
MNALNAIAIAIPTITVLFGILLNRQDASSIRMEMKSEIGQLRAKMIQLRNTIHSDMIGLHERLATVEAKQNR